MPVQTVRRTDCFACLLGIWIFFALPSAFALQDQPIPYYGDAFYQKTLPNLHDTELIEALREILISKHHRVSGGMDEIGAKCDAAQLGCSEHRAIGYKTARKVIMGQLFYDDSGKEPVIHEVYCEKAFSAKDFEGKAQPGAGKVPNHNILNVEHTWPESRFNQALAQEMQKSDLHHLFPSDSQINSIRGSWQFAEIQIQDKVLKCPNSHFGKLHDQKGHFFEPPDSHKGNVARALFYFSVRYQLKIAEVEERFLKKWNEQDPVDTEERSRNDQIEKIQGNRNPFVDFPELANKISNF